MCFGVNEGKGSEWWTRKVRERMSGGEDSGNNGCWQSQNECKQHRTWYSGVCMCSRVVAAFAKCSVEMQARKMRNDRRGGNECFE
jgi:hypothetical protein